jgi:TRAP transporter TAXI family solute receptor
MFARAGWTAAVGLAMVVFGAVACRGDVPAAGDVVIAAGGGHGAYHAYAQGVARAVRTEGLGARVVVTGSAAESLTLAGRGGSHVAFVPADLAALGVSGVAPFRERVDVSGLARLYDDYIHLVVAADSGIEDLTGLRGRKVATGLRGSDTELVAGRLLTVAGVDARREALGVADAAAALREGKIDAFFHSGGVPNESITQLTHVMGIRLIDLGAYVGPLRGLYGEFYQERSIPASAYRLFSAPRTVGVPSYLVVSSSMPAARAETLVRALFARKDLLVGVRPEARYLNRRAAISTSPLPLHPGAARYYRDSKVAG